MEAKNLADSYDLPLLDWARIEARLDQGLTQAPDTGYWTSPALPTIVAALRHSHCRTALVYRTRGRLAIQLW